MTDVHHVGALVTAHRLFVGALLLAVPEALDCVTHLLLDDQRARDELLSCEDWLLSSAQRLPPSMHSVRLLRLLSTSPTLDHFH